MPISDVSQLKLQQGSSEMLIWAANVIATLARAKAPTSRIRSNIKVSRIEFDNTRQTITIYIRDDEAPEALAYEFGSGIWGEKGEKYPILPKNASMLAFDWPDAASIAHREGVTKVTFVKNAGDMGPGKRVILPGVMHPGVQAKPYMKPALDESIEMITEKVADKSVTLVADMIVEKL